MKDDDKLFGHDLEMMWWAADRTYPWRANTLEYLAAAFRLERRGLVTTSPWTVIKPWVELTPKGWTVALLSRRLADLRLLRPYDYERAGIST